MRGNALRDAPRHRFAQRRPIVQGDKNLSNQARQRYNGVPG
ncbi:DUF1534 domain-containing protein [Pseudomonas syringae pv. tomato]|nr:DUF1534 domain-containing protein [Pseudomonas syringae pv. tomato]